MKEKDLKLDSVICDAPARSFIKKIKAHNGYHGCDKCEQPGDRVDGRMTYPLTTFRLRTDESFKERHDEEHHHVGPHPSEECAVGMISLFPLEYMHLVCLGVVRKLLLMWMRGPLIFRLPSKIVDRISDRLVEMRPYVPVEFVRRPRSLREVDHWKATEFREFLLGSVVLMP